MKRIALPGMTGGKVNRNTEEEKEMQHAVLSRPKVLRTKKIIMKKFDENIEKNGHRDVDFGAQITLDVAEETNAVNAVPENKSLDYTTDHFNQAREFFKPILSEVKLSILQNTKPILFLQIIAIIFVVLYYTGPLLSPLNYLGKVKADSGYSFSAISTWIFGVIIPFPFQVYFDKSKQNRSYIITRFIFYSCFWIYVGVQVDFFYRMQSVWWGDENDASTLLCKLITDHFCYSLFYYNHVQVTLFKWEQSDFSFKAFYNTWSLKNHVRTWLTVQISGWIIWIPVCACVYAMPSDIQIPLFNMTLSVWVLILALASSPVKASSQSAVVEKSNEAPTHIPLTNYDISQNVDLNLLIEESTAAISKSQVFQQN